MHAEALRVTHFKEQVEFKNSPCDVYRVQRSSHTIIHKQTEEKQSQMKENQRLLGTFAILSSTKMCPTWRHCPVKKKKKQAENNITTSLEDGRGRLRFRYIPRTPGTAGTGI